MKYPEDFLNKIVCGDSSVLLKEIPDNSIDLVVTSFPYSNLRTYKGYNFDFKIIGYNLSKIIKKGGIICSIINDQYVNGGRDLESFKQALYFKEECGLLCHDIMVYAKKNFSHPSFNRYHQIWEQIQIFSKGKPKTFNPIMDRKNLTAGALGNFGRNSFTEVDGSKSYRKKQLTKEFGMRWNLWSGLTAGQEDCCKVQKHPAKMPRWLARDLIISWSNENDIVLDCCVGSGTVCTEAKKINRNYIGIDVSQEYCNLAINNLI